MNRVQLFTFKGFSIFTFKVDMHFMRKEMELQTFFTLPRLLNTEFLSYLGNELDDFPPILILVKTKGLDYLLRFSLQNTKDLGVLYFPILLNTEGANVI